MAEYYTTDEVARFCKVSRSSVIRWVHEGKLKASVTLGGHHRILKEDLMELLDTLNLPGPELKGFVKPVVLIVDDEESIRQLLRFFIMQCFPHFQIEEAEDGFDAGIKIQKFHPELVLLDLRMPGQDGLALCKQIRDTPEFSKTIIIVITGVHDDLVQQSVLFFGANDYLIKPFNAESLRQKIEHHMMLHQRNASEDSRKNAA